MKKFLYSMLAAGMLLAPSCSQEEMMEVPAVESQQKTITVSLPSIESRAIATGINVGEGKMADKLVFAMYEEDKRNEEPLVTGFADRQEDGKFKVTVPMAKNLKYDLLFLAYNEEEPAFDIEGKAAKDINLNELKLKSSLSANKESYDAFVGVLDSHGIQDANSVTLTRPFAQINAVTTLEDLNAVKELKSEVTSSMLVITAPNTYNVFTGVASNPIELTYAASDIIEDITLADDTDAYPKNEKFNIEYYYLTLAYVLAGDEPNAPASTHTAKFEFYRGTDNKCVSVLDILSLPLQRNFRTNVMGSLLTKSEEYTISIDANFGEKDIIVDETGAMVVATEEGLKEAIEKAGEGTVIKLGDDITLSGSLTLPAGITFNGNGKQIDGSIVAGGDLTFAGHTKVTSFSASYYNRTITINEGACLEITGSDRASLGYGNIFNITGSITDAKSTDKETVQPSLIIPGISITGGNNATLNITNAYVKIGNTSSKNSAADGTFTLNITNSIAEFTNQFTLSEPTNGMNPTFKMNVTNSVLTTGVKFCIAAPNSNIVIDNSTVTLGSYLRNSGNITLINGSVLTGATIQFGESGGNNGTINVDASTLTINATSTGHAFDGLGKGSINLTNGATASVTYYKKMTITTDATSTFTGTEVN